LKSKLRVQLLKRNYCKVYDNRQAEDELPDDHRARREAQVEIAERAVPQEQDREDEADDDRRKSKTSVANCKQNSAPGKLCVGEPSSDRHSKHHAGERRGNRNQERLADDCPGFRIAGH
jgi:hypothetical protein